jgi:hypothetical protein
LLADRTPLAPDETESNGGLKQNAAEEDLRARILEWYSGYTWDGKTHILNLWSVLNFFDTIEFSEYWFNSG